MIARSPLHSRAPRSRANVVVLLLLEFVFALTSKHAFGQRAFGQSHGIWVDAFCADPVCPGDPVDCQVQIGHDDGFGDAIEIKAVKVALTGDDEIVLVSGCNFGVVSLGGNTTCTVGGQLPCLVCAGGSTCDGAPVSPDPGVVVLRLANYLVPPDAIGQIEYRAVVFWQDLCDSSGAGGTGCSVGSLNKTERVMLNLVQHCDDSNPCTTDLCAPGTCTFVPDCQASDDCPDDGNTCTTENCDANGCCGRTPDCVTALDCPDDGNSCTTVICTLQGCCENEPICAVDCDYNDLDPSTVDTRVGWCGEYGDVCMPSSIRTSRAASRENVMMCTADVYCGTNACCADAVVNSPDDVSYGPPASGRFGSNARGSTNGEPR